MLIVEFAIAGLLVAAGAWAAWGHGEAAGAAPRGGTARPSAPDKTEARGTGAADAAGAERANRVLSERLWNLAFGATPQAHPLAPEQAKIRDCVAAVLESDALDPKYFPRRPTLMPQLLRAVDDPGTAPATLARIVAHDPVLTADVLRLANSSLYRTGGAPIETIQRAVVVLGVDALRGVVASAMLQPVFRATRSNFPRFPRMLWERTERAVRAAEACTAHAPSSQRFEAQLSILLSALGPLAVYAAAVDIYTRNPAIAPSPTLCVALVSALGPPVSLRIARHWEVSPRLQAAIERVFEEPLTAALCGGELSGTLALLVRQNVVTRESAQAAARDSGIAQACLDAALA